jgi:Leucine-rich repeat (LRR) protein
MRSLRWPWLVALALVVCFIKAASSEPVEFGGCTFDEEDTSLSRSGECASVEGRLSLKNMNLVLLPPGVFDGLFAMTWLELSNNNIEALPEGIFSNLTSLRGLAISFNALETIPASLFRQLHALEYLELRGNSIAAIEAASFDGLAGLKTLYLVSGFLGPLSDSE